MNYKRYYLEPGYIFVSSEPYIITTVLGSCISVALWDKRQKIGGMNHYILAKTENELERTTRYGNVSIPLLIRLMKENGSEKKDIVAYVAGGAVNEILNPFVREENIKMAEDLLEKYKIKVLKKDVRGFTGRKINFNTYTGEFEIINFSDYKRIDE